MRLALITYACAYDRETVYYPNKHTALSENCTRAEEDRVFLQQLERRVLYPLLWRRSPKQDGNSLSHALIISRI